MSDQIGNARTPRLLAYLADNLFAMIIAFVVMAVIRPQSSVLGGVVVSVLYLLYFFAFEALWGKTPAKFFQKLEVRKIDGSRCSVSDAAIRTLARILEANPLLFGGLPAVIAVLSTKRKQRIGDILAHTIVVSKDS